MIFITQLIYVKAGQEAVFQDFERKVIPLMKEHGGSIIQRIRPTKDSFVEGEEKKPYEVHFMSFESEAHLTQYINDPRRQQFTHQKQASIESSFLVVGEER